jgi:hypothetical protein
MILAISVTAIGVAVVIAAVLFRSAHLSVDTEGLPVDPVSKDFVAARADASLIYPGARLMTREASPEYRAGNFSAAVNSTIHTGAPAAVVLDWYATTLQARGWQLVGSSDDTNAKLESGTQRGRSFRRGRREVISIYLCDRCTDKGPLGPEPVRSGEIDIKYSILPYSCAGRPDCGQGISFG